MREVPFCNVDALPKTFCVVAKKHEPMNVVGALSNAGKKLKA